ncbi:MAG: hypothetical protein OXD35_00750 [Thiotrichales bacterium]|nr:hypothetical protein [Thiotrichales bacterium]
MTAEPVGARRSLASSLAPARIMLAAASLLAVVSPLGALEVSGRVEIEPRAFLHAPEHPPQERHGLSFAIQPEFYQAFDDNRQSLLFTPFLRVDSADDRRSHFDVRELMYQRVFDDFDLRAGIGRVFWGVTESYHLVDVINQTDLVENVDLEDKLGQPLVNLSFARDWGVLDLFVLPGFRERTYPGREGRLRSEPFVDTSRATYESGAGRDRVDFAMRWSHTIGDFDIGVAHFRGTSREPRLLPLGLCADGQPAPPSGCSRAGSSPTPPAEVVLAPHYDVVRRTSLDLQATKEAMLWKAELLHESGPGDAYLAWVAGFEYTWFGIRGSDRDLGLLVEHLFDGRGGRAPHPLENDLFAGIRLGLNDEASTELVAAIVADAEGDATALTLEASRRIRDDWRVELEARAWNGVERDDPMAPLRRDDYIQLTLVRFF